MSKTLEQRISERFGVPEKEVMETLKATAFKQRDNKQISDAQMRALLIVADQYGLNPFTKELYAYADKGGGIVPVVSVDGWVRIINDNPMLNGIEFNYSGDTSVPRDGKECPAWCEAVIYRKDRAKPITVREYLDEVYVPKGNYNGPWQTHTKRMLRHKALIQCARIAFGFAGIYDDDEAIRIINSDEPIPEAPKVEQPRALPTAVAHGESIDELTGSSRPVQRQGEAVAGEPARAPQAAQDAAQQGAPSAEPCSEGEINFIRQKLKRMGMAEADALSQNGLAIATLEQMDKGHFATLKTFVMKGA